MQPRAHQLRARSSSRLSAVPFAADGRVSSQTIARVDRRAPPRLDDRTTTSLRFSDKQESKAVYCTVEGISWLSATLLVLSDLPTQRTHAGRVRISDPHLKLPRPRLTRTLSSLPGGSREVALESRP